MVKVLCSWEHRLILFWKKGTFTVFDCYWDSLFLGGKKRGGGRREKKKRNRPTTFFCIFCSPFLVLVNIVPTWHSSNEVGTFLSPSDQVNFVTFSSSSFVLVNAVRKSRSSARIVAHSYTYSSHEFCQYVTEKSVFSCQFFLQPFEIEGLLD